MATDSSVFVETSALLRVLFREADWGSVRSEIRSASRVVASRLLQVELFRTVHRVGAGGRASEGELAALEREIRYFLAATDIIEVDREVCDLASRLAPRSALRSLDAIHVASYSILRAQLPSLRLVSRDQRIVDAIGTLG